MHFDGHSQLSPVELRQKENRKKILPVKPKNGNRCGKGLRNVRDTEHILGEELALADYGGWSTRLSLPSEAPSRALNVPLVPVSRGKKEWGRGVESSCSERSFMSLAVSSGKVAGHHFVPCSAPRTWFTASLIIGDLEVLVERMK